MPPRIPHEALVVTMRRLLRPVVRQLLAWGVSYPVFDRVVRGLFVAVAEEDFSLPHKRQTDSRVSLVTGIHRKEIARLRRQPSAERNAAPLEDAVVTRVIGRWMAGPPFADRAGRARPIAYEARRPRDPSFARLVHEAGFDGPVRSVLDEMIRLGAVRWRADGNVVLVREANVPIEDLGTKLDLLGNDPGELFRTIVHNIEEPGATWLQRKVVYDNIGSESLPSLRAEARSAGESLVRRANVLLGARDRDRDPAAPGGERSRVVLATYYFEEPAADPDARPPSPNPSARLPGRITMHDTVKKRSR